MKQKTLENIYIRSFRKLMTPKYLHNKLPLPQSGQANILLSRSVVRNILDRKDKRLLVVCGPCSIHDLDSAREYANKLKKINGQLSDQLYIIMRVYFEKPRTVVGWKGLINDPDLNGSFNIEKGLYKARNFLLELARMNLPCAAEALDPVIPQYLGDLFCWIAIGARTSESQTHRELASGLSMPVGFKNSTDGSIDNALNAMKSSQSPHSFLGIDEHGEISVVETTGNPYGHLILRGGKKPNYDKSIINDIENNMKKAKELCNIIIDCSHANSFKNPKIQPVVLDDIIKQIKNGNNSIIGIMLESNLFEGKQSIPKNLADLAYGISITDACLSWDDTENLLKNLANSLKDILPARNIFK